MGIARSFRILLGLAAALLVVWAFVDVGSRWLRDDRDGRDVLLRIVFWGSHEERGIVQAVIDAFEREHPNIKVRPIHADFGNFDQKFKTMMAAGQPPDLMYLRSDDVGLLGEMGVIEPLDDYLARDPLPWFDDFYPVLIEAFSYDAEQDIVGQGSLLGLPKDFTTFGFYVNVDLFERAGVPVPYDGWTWDELAEAARRITALREREGDRIFGVHFQSYYGVMRGILWNFGADMFAVDEEGRSDFARLRLDTPEAKAALEYIRRLRIDEGTAFNATGIARDAGAEFTSGYIGAFGPVGRWTTPTYRGIAGFNFDFVPMPHAPGVEPVSNVATTAWAITAGSRHKDEAWELLKFLAGPEGQRMTGELGLAIPALRSVAESDHFLQPGQRPANSQLFLDLIETSRIAQEPRQREINALVDQEVTAATQIGSRGVAEAVRNVERRWAQELASPLRTREYPQVAWWPVLGVAFMGVAALGGLLWWRARREPLGPLDRAQERAGFLFISPWLIGFALLTAGPMVLSLVLAFLRWNAMTPMSEAQFVGFDNFTTLFRFDDTFYQSLWVTFYYVALAVPITQVAALAVALLMNQAVRGIEIFRTVYFLPSVITGVAMGTLWLALFNNDFGLINEMLRPPLRWMSTAAGAWPAGTYAVLVLLVLAAGVLGARALWAPLTDSWREGRVLGPVLGWATLAVIITAMLAAAVGAAGRLTTGPVAAPPDWFGADATLFAVPAFVIMSVWGVGSAMVIYLAGLKSIPVSLYEAGTIDGTGRWRRFWNITLPMLSPLVFFNVVMGLIGSFQIFTQAYVMTGRGPDNATLFYVLNLFYQAFEFHNMGYASAMAWILFLIILLFTLLIFRGSRNLVHYEGLR